MSKGRRYQQKKPADIPPRACVVLRLPRGKRLVLLRVVADGNRHAVLAEHVDHQRRLVVLDVFDREREIGSLPPLYTCSCQSSPSACLTLQTRQVMSRSSSSVLNFSLRSCLSVAGLPSTSGLNSGDMKM